MLEVARGVPRSAPDIGLIVDGDATWLIPYWLGINLDATHFRTSTAFLVAVTIAISCPITASVIGTISSIHFSTRICLARAYWSRAIGGLGAGL